MTKRITGQRIVHDVRRRAAREMRRAGISEGEIMKLCGWRARSMFDRYNVIDEHDLAVAVAKRFAKGKGRQSEEAPATSSDSLTSSGTTTPL